MEKCSCFFQIVLFLWCSTASVKSEVFTALTDLEVLVQTESSLFNNLEDYIRAEEKKLDYLKRYAETHHKKVTDVHSYVANPLNAYTLIKRLTIEWRKVQVVIRSDSSQDFLANFEEIKKFPTSEDLDGAALALARLQETYRLNTSSLASGKIRGVQYETKLSASDCFELGKSLYKNRNYYYAQLWLKEADSRLTKEVNKTAKKTNIVEYWAISAYKHGDIPLALDLTKKLVDVMPQHPRALKNQIYYEDVLERFTLEKTEEVQKDKVHEIYTQLCRGEISLPIEKSSKLKCRYLRKNHPFLLLAPFKLEEAHHKPDIFIFRDVLTDSEIDTIRRLAEPKLTRAEVRSGHTHTISQYRISKLAWLDDQLHKHIEDVSRRVADMTGLTVDTAERLQVLNYGIGGHYEPHFDFASKGDERTFEHLGTGNRIATVLFYLSDVEQGGATVFPEIEVALWPQKGSAVFWHNLHLSGDGDRRTGHAACPVLLGSKWVANRWIHERGQEFLRPCTSERPSQDLIV